MDINLKTAKPYNLTTDEERLAKMAKALGHPARMQVIRYLRENPQCITGDIVDAIPLAQATVSQHLKVLRDSGLISGTVDGPAVNYCINEDNMTWFKRRVSQLL